MNNDQLNRGIANRRSQEAIKEALSRLKEYPNVSIAVPASSGQGYYSDVVFRNKFTDEQYRRFHDHVINWLVIEQARLHEELRNL